MVSDRDLRKTWMTKAAHDIFLNFKSLPSFQVHLSTTPSSVFKPVLFYENAVDQWLNSMNSKISEQS
jgi:hypothetical protein